LARILLKTGMTKIAFSVNDRSGFVRANLVPLNRSQEKNSKLPVVALIAVLLLGVVELVFFLAK
jgi:hypothetical protein